MPGEPDVAISVDNVTHCFKQSIGKKCQTLYVLKDINLQIEREKFISFLGPSGCGKTTLLRLIDGLIKPTQGTIAIYGKPVRGPAKDRAMVFQEFGLLAWRTAQKNAEFGSEVQGSPPQARRQKTLEVIESVGLSDFQTYFPYQLSGGMKQRVGLARALCTEPEILLMDEPFGSLDPLVRELMQVELMRLLEGGKQTVVFVTHSIDEAIFLSDRIVVFGTRPGTIKEVIDIDLPRPRWQQEEDIKTGQQFVNYRRHIWSILKTEITRY